MRATGAPCPSAGLTIVAASIVSWRATIGAVARRFSRSARTSGVHGRFVPMATSAEMSARDSLVRAVRTVWIVERSATIAPTPIATQTKKKRRRRQDARISRHAITRTNVMIFRGAVAPRTPLHALSLAAAPARAVRVAPARRAFAIFRGAVAPRTPLHALSLAAAPAPAARGAPPRRPLAHFPRAAPPRPPLHPPPLPA